MERLPRISIVTPSFNQAKYIVAAIESVMGQDYPNVEHIVIDGGSTDGTLDRLGRYPHLKLVSEPDRGPADAVNKGFRLATGEVWGFLNSDDTLLPGALLRVAREIDPGRGRHIVMGRCRFVDEQGRFTGIEHPSRFESHRRVLEVWKGHTIPQPAVFWTPQVWKACGPMDDDLKTAWTDYDLFCRFSRRYRFHFVDQVLAASRLHSESKTERWAGADRLEDGIRVSRRYWGSPLTPMYWKLALSLALFRFNRVGRARHYFRRAQESWQRGEVLRAAPHALAAAILAPEVAFYVGVYPALRDRATGVWRTALDRRRPACTLLHEPSGTRSRMSAAIAVPSLDQGRFLAEALDSIFAQSGIDLSVAVVDGGSRDGSLAVLRRYEARLSYLRSAPDRGQAAAINEGIARLEGAEYVGWLNADDVLLPGALQRMGAYLDTHPECVAVFGDAHIIDESGRIIGRFPTRPFTRRALARTSIICQPASLIRRRAWDAVGGLDDSLYMCLDYDLWWRLSALGPIGFLREFVACSRHHAGTKTRAHQDRLYPEAFAVLRSHLGYVPWRWCVSETAWAWRAAHGGERATGIVSQSTCGWRAVKRYLRVNGLLRPAPAAHRPSIRNNRWD